MRITNDNYKVYSGVNFKSGIYLDNGRVWTLKKVDKVIKEISIEATFIEIKDSIIKFVKRIFNK